MDVIGASQGYRGVYQYSNGVKSLQMIDNTQDSFIFYGVPKYTNFFWTFFIAAFIVYFIYNLINSTYGKGFLAVKDDEVAAESMGINTTKFKVIAFVSGAFFAGVAGSLYGHFNLYLNPEDFNFLKSVEIVAMVISRRYGQHTGSYYCCGNFNDNSRIAERYIGIQDDCICAVAYYYDVTDRRDYSELNSNLKERKKIESS